MNARDDLDNLIDDCIKEGILVDYLTENREEVKEILKRQFEREAVLDECRKRVEKGEISEEWIPAILWKLEQKQDSGEY